MTPAAAVAEALTWLNTPYHHGARVRGAGADCGQFPAAVFEACGLVPRLDLGQYPHDWHLHRSDERYLRHVEGHFSKVPGPPLPGDLALFRYGRAVSHGAIVVDWPTVVHAYIGAGAVVLDDALANQDLARRPAGFYRLKQWTSEG
jgi:cell wall-associated NlpC family hydrolase